jgi:hypothetical protein
MGPANNKQQLYLRRTLVRLNFFSAKNAIQEPVAMPYTAQECDARAA